MVKHSGNPCSICGKDRIVVKTFQEMVGTSMITTSLMKCPDPECQAKIDKQLAKEKKFRDGMKVAAERRLQEKKERAQNTRLRA